MNSLRERVDVTKSVPLCNSGQTCWLSIIKDVGSISSGSLLQCDPLWHSCHLAISVSPWELGLWKLAQILLFWLLLWVVNCPSLQTLESPSSPTAMKLCQAKYTVQSQTLHSPWPGDAFQGNLRKHGLPFTRLTSLEMVSAKSLPSELRSRVSAVQSQWRAEPLWTAVAALQVALRNLKICCAVVYHILRASGLVFIHFRHFSVKRDSMT